MGIVHPDGVAVAPGLQCAARYALATVGTESPSVYFRGVTEHPGLARPMKSCGARGEFPPKETSVSTDAKASKILARTFFNQLRASGYTPTQVIGVATELIDLVTSDLKEESRRSDESDFAVEEARPAL